MKKGNYHINCHAKRLSQSDKKEIKFLKHKQYVLYIVYLALQVYRSTNTLIIHKI